MNKLTAVFLDKASLYPNDLDFSALDEVAQWQWFDNANIVANVDEARHFLATAEILVSNKVLLNKEVIDCCKQLKLICVAATGVNNVDVEAARQRGIQVCNVRAYATSSVVQHVFSLILALSRKLLPYHHSAKNGNWARSEFFCYFDAPFSDLDGKTLGIIGYGELGRSVEKIAQCFGMNVLIACRHNTVNESSSSEAGSGDAGLGEADSSEERVALTKLLSQSDVVSLHCPLTENNYHMIGEKEFALMKRDAILINTARGGLVDEKALLQVLSDKTIAGAGLDVLESEPPAANNVLLNYQGDNLIITPHIAWASRESRQRLVNEVAKNIQVFQQGRLRNVV